jgi:uncharacterized membrane protein YdcZ (DUF606 family)
MAIPILSAQFALVMNLISLGLTFVLWGLDKTGWLEKTKYAKHVKLILGILFILVGLFYFYLAYSVEIAHFP